MSLRMLLIMAFSTLSAWFFSQSKAILFEHSVSGYFAMHCGVLNGLFCMLLFFFVSFQRISFDFCGINKNEIKQVALPCLLYSTSIGIIFAWLKHPF